jgi:hypothetical protein
MEPDSMLLKFGALAGLGVAASLLALYWVQPDTNGGQALLALIVFSIVNGIGGLIWRVKS